MPEPALAQSPLLQLIAAHGPISLADYMASANAHYYATRDPLGAAGDFTTAPEISQMFGELVGLALADSWMRAGQPSASYVELGPGRGTLARDALGAMARAGLHPPVHLVETSPVLAARQQALVPAAMHHTDIDALPGDGALLIVANEFFDALPIRQLIRTAAGWSEMLVGFDQGALVAAPGAVPMDDQVPAMLRAPELGAVHEICPAAAAIASALAERIAQQGGCMLIIDYGHAGPALGDTLQAVRAHQFTSPFADPGEADLTAHVDFTALAKAARDAGAAVTPLVTQGDWLTRLGIDARTAALAARHPDRAPELQGQRDRLVNSNEMGQLFKVLAIHHPNWPLPAGFAP